jgi:acetyl-CoA acetyltransferase family protein
MARPLDNYDDDDVVVLGGARTAVGRFAGALSSVSATELGAVAARGAIERAGVEPAAVDDVYVGNVLQSSADAAYLARHVALKAGVPVETPAVVVNRACGSALEAVVQGARALLLDEATVVLAGGAENMSQMPYVMRGARRGLRMGNAEVEDALFSALFDPMAGCSIGETVEHLAAERGITRDAADALAVRSQRLAAQAQERGVLGEEIVAVDVPGRRGASTRVDVDENLRPDTTLDGLAPLRGLFAKDGVVTAGNSSGLNDAAAMLVLARGVTARERDLEPLGRVIGWGACGVEPKLMGLGPVEASRRALAKAGIGLDDVDVIELNDSFTVQSIAVEAELGLDREKINPNGGAIALGHPMGATGARLVLAALHELRRRDARYALCTVCIGGGQGNAVVVERP